MTDYLERAVAHLGIEADSVVKHRQEDGEYVLLSDQGIAGVKKYCLPLSRLDEPQEAPEPEQESEPVEPDPEPDADPEPAADPEPESEVYVCADCGRDFDTERGLSVHQRYCDILPDEEE